MANKATAALLSRPSLENILSSQVTRSYLELTPNMVLFGKQWNLGEADSRKFYIFWAARNGNFEQQLHFRKIDNKWLYATRVIRKKKTLLEHIQQGFPKNEIFWKK